MRSNQVIDEALRNFDSFQIPKLLPDKLSLLEGIQQDRLTNQKPFADFDVLFIQHHLGPFIGRLNAMIECGLDPKRTWFVDIPYSTNLGVVKRLKNDWFSEEQMTEIFNDPLEKYDSVQEQRVSELMEKIAKREDPRPLLVIDDGAYFARYLNNLKTKSPGKLKDYFGTSVVEQTTRGHRYLFNDALEVILRCALSVVTIARCKTKKAFEAPFIGAAVSRALKRSIGEERISHAKHIAVIGFGVVGEKTVNEICRNYPDANIDIVDIDASKRKRASQVGKNCEGYPQLREDRLYDIVLGCTGYNSFHLDQRKLLSDKAILASGSSAAIEFNRAGFIELADEYDDDDIEILNRTETVSKGIHAEVLMREKDKTFTFLNAGFPVNFDGKIESLPAIIIQATHGLLFMATIQSLSQKGPRITSINPDEDEWIFKRAVGELSNSL